MERPRGESGYKKRRGCAERCQHHGLREKLAQEPASAYPQSEPNRHLAASADRSGKQENGDVEARDQKHDDRNSGEPPGYGDLGARLLAFTALSTLVAGLLSGVLPAFQASKPDIVESLRAGGRGMTFRRSRTRAALLIGQAALSVVLLVGAGLFVRSLRQARTLDLGFDADRIAVVSIRWNERLPGAERRAIYDIYDEALERVRRLPGVQDAGLTTTSPFGMRISLSGLRVPGQDSFPAHPLGGPWANRVSSGYFEAMGLGLVQGRTLQPEDDREGAPPVTIITESLANAIWPTANPLGQCMLIPESDDEDLPCTEVIGVVENHRLRDLVEEDPHFLYFLNQRHPGRIQPPQVIVARTSGEVSTHLASLRAEVQGTSSQIRFVEVLSLQDRVDPEFRSWTLGAVMFSMFGLLALVVAGCGLYSILAFDVAQRRHELGIRIALGASVDRLVRFVLRQAMVLVGLGIGIGLAVSRVAARYVDPMLFEVSASDLGIYLLVGVVLLLVAALAGSLPAWRATRVDPREALQAD